MTDAHCHLDNPQFKQSPDLSSLKAVITCGAGLASSKRVIEIANKIKNVYAAVGLGYEPKFKNWIVLEREFLQLCQNSKVVAIGECGLDSSDPRETELLKFHLKIAENKNLPLIIHNRNQDKNILNILGDYPKVMLHCFTGEMDFMKESVERGWYISFGGILTFKKSECLRDIAKLVPDDKLLIETDSPYLSPTPVRNKQNQPKNVKIVAELLASIRNTSINQIEEITDRNVKTLFNI